MTTADKPRLSRQTMCDRLAMEFQDGWIVNLGVGMPTLCSNYLECEPDKEIIFHSENGVIGYGPLAPAGEEDRHLVNAGGQNVVALPGMAIVHHADSFGLIRKGMVDVTVMGAYEVSENGDFANWRIPVRKGGGIGGAMDLAACAKRVFIAMEHNQRNGAPRVLKSCNLPITAPGVVKLLATDLGLFEITEAGFVLREHAPGWSPEDIQEQTEAKLIRQERAQRIAWGMSTERAVYAWIEPVRIVLRSLLQLSDWLDHIKIQCDGRLRHCTPRTFKRPSANQRPRPSSVRASNRCHPDIAEKCDRLQSESDLR